MQRSKQELAISTIKAKISRWNGTFEMETEYPKLKKDLKYIKKLLKEEKFKLAENHLYYTMTKMYDESLGIPVNLAHDLENIQKAIQDIGKDLVHRAAITSATLLDSFGNEELEERDLEIMQDCVTRLENYIEPYIPEENSNDKKWFNTRTDRQS